MARVQLASQRLNTPKATGQLRPSLLSSNAANRVSAARVSAPRINPNAARVQFTPMPVPKIQTDSLTNALSAGANFADHAVKSAWDYQEREHDVYARYAQVGFQDKMRQILQGEVDENGNMKAQGYLHTEGIAATEGYKQFQHSVNQAYSDILTGLEPRARQKAMLALSSERDTVLNKGALHRSKQLQVAEEDARYQRRKGAVLDIATDPGTIYRRDKFTGLSGKAKFYKEFTSVKDADKAWFDLIGEVGEKIYLEQGFQKAEEFYSNVGAVELAGSPAHLTKMMSNIVKWENESIRAENSTRELEFKLAQRDKKQLWDSTQGRIEQMILDGNPPSKAMLSELLEAQMIDPGYAKAVRQDVFGEVDALADPAKIRLWMERLESSAANNFEYTNSDGSKGTWSQEYKKDPTLDPAARSHLSRFEDGLRDPDNRKSFVRGKQEIATWMKGPFWDAGLHDKEYETMINQAENELFNRLENGETYETIIPDLKKRYNSAYIEYNTTPPLSSGFKPRTLDEVQVQKNTIEQKFASKGYKSKADYEADLFRLNRYVDLLIQIQKLQGIDESLIQSDSAAVTPEDKVLNTVGEQVLGSDNQSPEPTEGGF